MTIEQFELTDDNIEAAPDWVKESMNANGGTVLQMPLLLDELVKYRVYSSKGEARNAIKNGGLSVFAYESGEQFSTSKGVYKTIDGETIDSFNSKQAVIKDPNVRWSFIEGDVVKKGKRAFVKFSK